MEPNLWTRFVEFVKESYTSRLKHAFSGICMGFIGAQHLLYSGVLANLVTNGWWIFKGICTVILAFCTSLATAYASKLVEIHMDKNREKPQKTIKNEKANRSDHKTKAK